jgi:hypothetical protein
MGIATSGCPVGVNGTTVGDSSQYQIDKLGDRGLRSHPGEPFSATESPDKAQALSKMPRLHWWQSQPEH